jgi:hypothetical protein
MADQPTRPDNFSIPMTFGDDLADYLLNGGTHKHGIVLFKTLGEYSTAWQRAQQQAEEIKSRVIEALMAETKARAAAADAVEEKGGAETKKANGKAAPAAVVPSQSPEPPRTPPPP